VNSKLATPAQVSLSNQSSVFEAFGDDEKLTITEATNKVNTKLTTPLSEQTVRRAIKALIQSGFLIEQGRRENAMLYGKLSASFARTKQGEGLVPLAGTLMPVEDFVKLMVIPGQKPLQLKKNILADPSQIAIRKMLTFVILNGPEPGMEGAVKTVSGNLYELLAEVEHLRSIVKGFIDSPVWFSQYQDRIGYEIRKMQENDPGLYQLAQDFIRGG
jgi:hypothetical protein